MILLHIAALAAAAPLQPTGKWVVDFSDSACVASRDYGTEQLALKASPLGDVVQFALVSRAARSEAEQVDATLQPAGGSLIRTTGMIWGTGGDDPHRITSINLKASEFQRVAAASTVSVTVDGRRRDLVLSGMAPLAVVMKECVTDLATIWTNHEGVSSRAKSDLATYVKDTDFPEEGIRKGVGGTTAFALLIDEKGMIADCTVIETSGQAMYDSQSCALLKKRARFTPARDAAGKPHKDSVIGKISWIVP